MARVVNCGDGGERGRQHGELILLAEIEAAELGEDVGKALADRGPEPRHGLVDRLRQCSHAQQTPVQERSGIY